MMDRTGLFHYPHSRQATAGCNTFFPLVRTAGNNPGMSGGMLIDITAHSEYETALQISLAALYWQISSIYYLNSDFGPKSMRILTRQVPCMGLLVRGTGVIKTMPRESSPRWWPRSLGERRWARRFKAMRYQKTSGDLGLYGLVSSIVE